MVPARPFLRGRPGWVRSRAWIWLFSSKAKTTARSGGSVAVMGHGSSAPLLEGKTWLGAVEGLDLALLVESEDNGPLRGIDVETHHVAQLFNEVRISGQLEVLDAVGL